MPFTELPEGCDHLVDTYSGPPALLKRCLALVALGGAALAAWRNPRMAASALASALLMDSAVLMRFRRRDKRGPLDQQAMIYSWKQHAATLVRLRDAIESVRVLAAVRLAADGQSTRLVMAGRPQLTSKRSPILSAKFPGSEPTPWHLFFVTEHRTGADYQRFCRAADLGNDTLVEKSFVAGFAPPSRLIYPLLPLLFDVVGVVVQLCDLLLGRASRSAFAYKACEHEDLRPLIHFSENALLHPASAAQQ